MTQTHPITPPTALVQQWRNQAPEGRGSQTREMWIATQSARWSADQELEACCAEVSWQEGKALAVKLRERRRPKPPSLKQQALAALEDDEIDVYLIRRALEALDD